MSLGLRGEKSGERWRKKVRYHIPTVAVACFEYPGEIPEADHMEMIGDREEKDCSVLLKYILYMKFLLIPSDTA